MLNQKYKFSVVIPLYNKASHILDTIQYIKQQTYSAYEIIVVDDGSTDEGADLILQHEAKNVRLIWQKNAGVSVARNTGIQASTGDYIALMDADDQWSPQYLEEIAHLIETFSDAVVYSTAYQCVDAGGVFNSPKVRYSERDKKPHIINNYFKACSEGELPFFTSSVVFKKDITEHIGLFPVGENMGEDQDFFFRAALFGRIAYSPRVLSFYMRNAENRICISHLPEDECPYSTRLTEMANTLDENPALARDLLRCSGGHLLHIASRNIVAGNLLSAKKLLNDYRCKLQPVRLLYWRTRLVFKSISASLSF